MRLPTVNQLKMQNDTLAAQYAQLARLQAQASSNKKLLASSDDPFLADQIKSTQTYLSQLKSYNLNMVLAENRVNQKESIVAQSINVLDRSNELILYAQNDTLNDNDRLLISNELQGLLDQLYSLANTSDINGEYIYSGFNLKTPPFAKQGTNYVYKGSDEIMQIEIGNNTRINYTDSGYKVFGAIPNGNGQIYTRSNVTANTGTGIISDGSIINNSKYIADQYTISFVTNSSGQQAYTITGTNSGQVIPAPPLNSPNDAPQFITGQPLSFNGINLLITGQPNNGDTFFVEPSTNQNIFTTLTNLIQVLQNPGNTATDKTNLKQQLINFGSSLNQAHNHFLSYETELGEQGKIIENQKLLADNLIANEEAILSQLSDVDLVTLLSNLTQQMTIIQLTQETYLKIQQSFYSLLSKG